MIDSDVRMFGRMLHLYVTREAVARGAGVAGKDVGPAGAAPAANLPLHVPVDPAAELRGRAKAGPERSTQCGRGGVRARAGAVAR